MKNKKKILIYLILIGTPIFTMTEGICYQKVTHEHRFRSQNIFLPHNLDTEYQKALKTINSDQYQAIIPLPFYQESENFFKHAHHDIYPISYIFAYHFKLPLMASDMSRTSIWESRNLIQMFAPEYYEKLIAEAITSNKKFLIVSLSDSTALTEYEHDFLKKATFLLKVNEVEFWEITPDKITEVITAPYFEDFNQKRDSLFVKDNYLLSKRDTTVFLFSFDTNSTQYSFLGNGAYQQPKKEKYSLFAKIEAQRLDEDREYEASLWCYVGGKNYGQDKLHWMIFISQQDENTQEIFPLFEAGSRTTPVVLGDWALATYRFTIKDKNLLTRFVISHTNCKGYQTTIDEFLIRPVDVDVYRVLEQNKSTVTKLYKNGQIIGKP